MIDCCHSQEYEAIFDTERAARDAARYREQGLKSTAQQIVTLLRKRDIDGHSLLEVGGGIGDMQIELLRAGVARAVNVELSPAYEEAASRLLEDAGMEGRVERHVTDFVEAAGDLQDADIVVMNMVVCCYPDMERLVRAAAGKARRYLAISFPRDLWLLSYLMPWVINLRSRLKGSDFRFFVHPPPKILATATAAGLRVEHQERGWLRRVALFSRPAPV
ncbi:MAG: methyltransferase domain-containing protein [Candidatus Promineifilaceae bacterium]|nr:methyltransferase domain-containing protein [Candidatus Promineifilaceae bacterium]